MIKPYEIEKGWGSELIWASNDLYCGKILRFKKDAQFSLHFHATKDETWYVLSGVFLVLTIDTKTSNRSEKILKPGDTWHNPPLLPHQILCWEAGDIIEVSTKDSSDDNFRIAPGDSQKSIS